jgi:hypothetical protein
MKRLVTIVAALAISVTMSFAQNAKTGNEPFKADFSKLSSYLELEPYQMTEVYKINEFFIQKQSESFVKNPLVQDVKMRDAVYGNLKLMKDVLNPEQYRKYVTVINVTNNNNKVIHVVGDSDIYLAENR